MSRKSDKSTLGLFEVEFGRKIRVVSAPKMWAWEIPGDEKSGWSTSWPVVGNGSQPYPQSHPPHMFKSQIRHNHIWKFQICDDMATSLCKGLGFISVRQETQNLSSYLREIWGTLYEFGSLNVRTAWSSTWSSVSVWLGSAWDMMIICSKPSICQISIRGFKWTVRTWVDGDILLQAHEMSASHPRAHVEEDGEILRCAQNLLLQPIQ